MQNYKRVVVIGAGFAGFNLVKHLIKKDFEVFLVDKNNYHQFQPLYYQVATAGLEPASISFPLRKAFQHAKNVHIRMAEVVEVLPDKNIVVTSEENLHYDYLVIATGVDTNYFGNKEMEQNTIPMKSVSQAIYMRNHFLLNLEAAYYASPEEKDRLQNVVIVGGGPTGVELSGAIADMKKYVLAKDYPELDIRSMNIYLVGRSPVLLEPMSEASQKKSEEFLTGMGVKVLTNTALDSYNGKMAVLSNGTIIPTQTVVWAAGVVGAAIKGLPAEALQRGNRLLVNRHNLVAGCSNVFAIGDISFMPTDKYPHGHPQLARVAISQGELLAKNMVRMQQNKPAKEYEYKDMGNMATVGRRKAVVDLPGWQFQGAFAWHVWNVIHLFSLIGLRNKLSVFISWAINYFSRDPNLRVLIRPFEKKVPEQHISQSNSE